MKGTWQIKCGNETPKMLELQLSDDADKFAELAEAVRRILNGSWKEKIDGLDQSYWEMDVGGLSLIIHREHYLGVMIYCQDEPKKKQFLEQIQRSFESK